MDQYDDLTPEIEGYCVRDRETVVMEDPEPVWTRKGMPATRGVCPLCGGTVFRMGKTELHDESQRPDPISIGQEKRKPPKLEPTTVYISYAADDEEIAQQIAADLEKVGIANWLHEAAPDGVKWAGGVHPALNSCRRMVYVLSEAGLQDESVNTAWQFFKDKRKPIVIAQIDPAPPPDPIRRSPRFDFDADYKTAFREMIQALSR